MAVWRDIKEAAAYNEIIPPRGEYRFRPGISADLDCHGRGKAEKKQGFKMLYRLAGRMAKICKLKFFEVLCISYCIFARNVYT